MAVTLEIRDGNPWYLSEDIWTVPGSDPEGAPGLPVVGQPCYLWARVRNSGDSAVQNATVRFYWANPAVGFDRNTANAIGTAFVTLDGGEQSEVLCLTPWFPVFVNDGHECVLAEAFHPSLDPLPASPTFNVPTDRHVAQRNLSVVSALKGMFHLAFEIHNPARLPRTFSIQATTGRLEELKPLIPTLGRDFKLPDNAGKVDRLGFVHDACPTPEMIEEKAAEAEKIELRPGERAGLSLVGRLEGGAALVHVTQQLDDTVVGGLSVLVRAEAEEV